MKRRCAKNKDPGASRALAIARRFAGLMPVYVPNRTQRRGYLSEAELEVLAALDVGGKAAHA